jgi:serine/threonine protein kinase/tetratricopeptide (TPR) repeat protein
MEPNDALLKTRPIPHLNGERPESLRKLHGADPGEASDLGRVVKGLPEVGTEFLGFRLIKELGKGSFGKVYLAEQGDLAHRRVALKVTPNTLSESQTLAQLQHTNIVPIYSVHRAGPLQAICMPYFGATTLADVLQDVGSSPSLPASGKLLVSTVNRRKALTSRPGEEYGENQPLFDSTSPQPAAPLPEEDAPALRVLEGMSYVKAMLLVGERLADGLAHAHERRILHLDLKPANILLTDWGEPMLLDFNLSRDSRVCASASGSVGGTLLYMAPEHLEAFRGNGQAVDARSDIFALGLVLYELLAGKHPYPVYGEVSRAVLDDMLLDRRVPPLGLRVANPAVSAATEAIIRRCLEPDPARRYQTARDLQEDLERHLHDLPLKHIPEPSLSERGRKWVRRHPRLSSTTSVALILGTILILLAAFIAQRGRALARLQAAEGWHQFHEEMKTAQVQLYRRHADQQQLEEGIQLARTTLGHYQVLEDSAWDKTAAVRYLPLEDQQRLGDEVGELLFLLARQLDQHAAYHCETARRPEEYRLALNYNTLAENAYRKDHVPRALWEQRAELVRQLGEEKEAEAWGNKALQSPRLQKDDYLLAHWHTIQGNYRQALALLEKVTQDDPENYSAWFVRGNCYYELQRNTEAVACFNACLALRPRLPWAWLNRGLAQLRLHHPREACADFDRVLRLDDRLADAYINRALAREEMGQYTEALEDLNQALKIGPGSSNIYFRLWRVHDKAGDKEGAKRDLEQCVKSKPANEYDCIARGLARKDDDPKGALADFDQALALNPRSFEGLQNKAALLSEKFDRDPDALRIMDVAVQHYPDSVLARGGRGILLARRGKRELALADGREALILDPSPEMRYQVAGIYALTSKQNPEDKLQALHLLSSALRAGAGLEWVDDDHDLDPLRKDAEFKRIVDAAKALQVRPPK